MTPLQIRGAIMLATNMMPNDFARTRNIHQTTLHRVINSELKTPRVRKAIADAIGRSEDEIFKGCTKKAPSSGHNTAVAAGTTITVPEDGQPLQAVTTP